MIGAHATPGPLRFTATWLSSRAHNPGGELVALAPAVWLLRGSRHWLPVSVLDTGRFGVDEAGGPERPTSGELAWQAGAACAGRPEADTEFFGRRAQQAFPPTMLAATKALCHSCVVERDCLTWALSSTHRLADGYVVVGERYGVWGGTTRRQRLKMFERIERGTAVTAIVNEVLDASA